jgi:hypothetical protein
MLQTWNSVMGIDISIYWVTKQKKIIIVKARQGKAYSSYVCLFVFLALQLIVVVFSTAR